MPSFLKTLFVNPPSWQGFDGGAGSRYQAKREIRSFWYPTWLAQPAALVPGSRLVDAPPHDLTKDDILRIARDYEAVVIHTSAPTLRGDAALADAGARGDPLVRSLDRFFQLGIRQHLFGKVAAGADDGDGALRQLRARAGMRSHDVS